MESGNKNQDPSASIDFPSSPAEKNNLVVSIDTKDKTSQTKLDIKSNSSSDDDEGNPQIPDGGWGWVVVFATFLLCMIADGVTFSFGLLYVEFLKEFGASKSATSWIGSLFMAVPLLSGPIMSALVDKYGCRIMTMIAGILSALGFVISSKCQSISLMYLTFGVIAGLGLGIQYVTVVVSVAFWFDKKRTLAVAIGASGIGMGTFIFSPITTSLLSEFGWRGTTLILGGCFLNMSVCGALMRDPDWIIEEDRKAENLKSVKASRRNSEEEFNAIDIDELKALLTRENDASILLQNLESSLEDNEDNNKLKNYVQSAINLPTFVRQHEEVPVEVLELLSTNKNVYNTIIKAYPSLVLSKAKSMENKMYDENAQRIRSPSLHQVSVREPLMGHRSPKHYQHEKYFKNLKLDTHSLVHRGAINTNKYRFKASSCPNIYKVSMVSRPKEREEKWYTEMVDLVKEMFDYSLFLEFHFLLLSFSTTALFVWFIVPYFYLAELMNKNGYAPEDASFTISNIGISNTIGMLVLGWAGDRPWMNIIKTCAVLLVLCGVSIAGLMYFVQNFVVLQICASLFGICLSSHFAFTPGIIVELVPLDKFTLAYGLQLLCQGIGTLLGPPYAGLLFDVTKSWEQSFYQAAVWIILSGICIGLIPYTKNRKLFIKGNVEKDSGQENRIIPLVLLSIMMFVFCVYVIYLTSISFL